MCQLCHCGASPTERASDVLVPIVVFSAESAQAVFAGLFILFVFWIGLYVVDIHLLQPF